MFGDYYLATGGCFARCAYGAGPAHARLASDSLAKTRHKSCQAIQGEGLREHGTEGLHQVQGKRPAAIFRDMKQTRGRIQPMGMQEGGDFVIKQRGPKAESIVDRIVRGAAGVALEGESRREEAGPDFKIPGRSRPLATPQFIDGAAPGSGTEHGFQAGESCPEVGLAVGGHAL